MAITTGTSALAKYNRVMNNYASSTGQSTVTNVNGTIAISGSDRVGAGAVSNSSGGGGGSSASLSAANDKGVRTVPGGVYIGDKYMDLNSNTQGLVNAANAAPAGQILNPAYRDAQLEPLNPNFNHNAPMYISNGSTPAPAAQAAPAAVAVKPAAPVTKAVVPAAATVAKTNKVAVMNPANVGKSASQIMTSLKPTSTLKITPATPTTKSSGGSTGVVQSAIKNSLYGNNSLESSTPNYVQIRGNILSAVSAGGSATTLSSLAKANEYLTSAQNDKNPISRGISLANAKTQLNVANNAAGDKTSQNVASLGNSIASGVKNIISNQNTGKIPAGQTTKISPQTASTKAIVSPTTSIAKLITPTGSGNLGTPKSVSLSSGSSKSSVPDKTIPALKTIANSVAKALTPTDTRTQLNSSSQSLLVNSLGGRNSLESIPSTITKSSGMNTAQLNTITKSVSSNVNTLVAQNKNNTNLAAAQKSLAQANAAKTDAGKQAALADAKRQLTMAKQSFK